MVGYQTISIALTGIGLMIAPHLLRPSDKEPEQNPTSTTFHAGEQVKLLKTMVLKSFGSFSYRVMFYRKKESGERLAV